MIARDFAPISSPVVVSIPHAGRHYPQPLLAGSRLSPQQLRLLEDRDVDLLAQGAAEAGHRVLIAETARAWIDLNRDPADLDPDMIESAIRQPLRPAGGRAASGLGLVPRRVPGQGEIYVRRLTCRDIAARVESVHRPWHETIALALDGARRRYGFAILLELHSMPTILRGQPGHGKQVIVGDRHGRSCDPAFVAALREEIVGLGAEGGINTPYAGAYALARHGRPEKGIHALQVEIDRALYLDGMNMPVQTRVGILSAWIAAVCARLADAGNALMLMRAAE